MSVVNKCYRCGIYIDSEYLVCDECAEHMTARQHEEVTKQRGKMVYHANNLKRPYMEKRGRREYQ